MGYTFLIPRIANLINLYTLPQTILQLILSNSIFSLQKIFISFILHFINYAQAFKRLPN